MCNIEARSRNHCFRGEAELHISICERSGVCACMCECVCEGVVREGVDV
jgi:hypothetical protein